jgi:hypothetical protein
MLIAHEMRDGDSAVAGVRPVMGALQLTIGVLSRWVGPDGCRALLTRALNRAGQDHPALAKVRVVINSAPALHGVDESVETNGPSAVAEGLTSTLVQLFALLGRVMGDDLTLKLATQITAGDTSDAAQGHDEEGNRNAGDV